MTLGDINHRLHILEPGVNWNVAARAQNEPAPFADNIDQPGAVVCHFLGCSKRLQRCPHVAHYALATAEYFLSFEDISAAIKLTYAHLWQILEVGDIQCPVLVEV